MAVEMKAIESFSGTMGYFRQYSGVSITNTV